MDFKEAGDDPNDPPGPPQKGFPIPWRRQLWVVPLWWSLLLLATCVWVAVASR